jgi:hypothetical protein
MPDEIRPHTRLGILATLVGVGAAFIELIAMGVLVVASRKDPDSTLAMLASIGAMLGVGVALMGELLAFGTLFFASKRKLYSVVGLLLNGIVVLSFCSLIAAGLLINKFSK